MSSLTFLWNFGVLMYKIKLSRFCAFQIVPKEITRCRVSLIFQLFLKISEIIPKIFINTTKLGEQNSPRFFWSRKKFSEKFSENIVN